MNGNNENSFPYKTLLTNRQIASQYRTFSNHSATCTVPAPANTKLSNIKNSIILSSVR